MSSPELPGRIVLSSPATPRLEMGAPSTSVYTIVPVPGPPGETPSRVTVVRAAAAALSGHRLVTEQTDGTLTYASNDDPAHVAAPLWLTVGAIEAGASGEALMFGRIVEPGWAWTPGASLYLGVNGQLTQTPPTAPGALFSARVGYALSATVAFIDRQPSIVLI